MGSILGFTGNLEADVEVVNTGLDWDPGSALAPSVKWILSLTAMGKQQTINELYMPCVTIKHTYACTAIKKKSTII